MSFYPERINERFQQPKNAGELNGANAVGTSASFVCGAFGRFYLQIEVETKKILAAKFKSNGCGFLIAAADALADKIVGRRLNEMHGSDREFLTLQIENELGNFPDPRRHCLKLCLEAAQTAFADFRASQITEFSSETALICTCFGISEETIENVIRANTLETVEEVTKCCGAGGGCGSCQPLIQETLDILQEENYGIIENY